MNTKLDIAKILTLSTAHIKPETATMLDNEPNTDDLGLSVYNKKQVNIPKNLITAFVHEYMEHMFVKYGY